MVEEERRLLGRRLATYHVLGERLAKSRKMTLLDEVAESKGILVSVTTGEALISHVEEWVVVALLDSIADGAPLLLGGINTSRVVCASMKQDDAVLGHVLDVLDHTVKVQTNSVLIVVSVLFHLQSRVLEDCIVVGPTGSGNVDGLCGRVVSLQESTADPQGTGSRDGLSDCDSAFLDWCRIGTVCEKSCSLGEFRDTGDACIFLVELLLDNLLLGGQNRGKDVRLSLVVAVCANTWQLLGEFDAQSLCLRYSYRG